MSSHRPANSYSKRMFSEQRGRMVNMIDRVALKTFKSVRRWIVTLWWDREGDIDDNVEVFAGIGYAARPPQGSNAEAVLVNIGGFDHPCLVALRDGPTAAAVIKKVGLEDDEVVVHTSKAIVKIKADGTVEIRSVDGTAVPLATKADVDAVNARVAQLESFINALSLPVTGTSSTGGAVTGSAGPPSPPSSTNANVSGTSILKAQ